VDNAAGSPHVVPLTGNGVSAQIAFLANPPLDFGNKLVGSTSSAGAVYIKNTGNALLTFAPMTVSGDFAVYTPTTTCGATLAASAECNVMITFTPVATGTRAGSLIVAGNAWNSPQTFALTGVGIAPAVGLDPAPPAGLTFAARLVNSGPSAAQTITVTNIGGADLHITGVGPSGDYGATSGQADFAIQNSTCPGAELEPDESCTISVTFTPTARGARTGSVSVASDAATSPDVVPLSGTGIAPVAGLAPASLDFLNVGVGVTSAAQTVTLSNTGDADLHVTGVAVSGDYAVATGGTCPAAPFTLGVANGDEFRAAVGGVAGSCTIKITFKPTVIGTRNGTLTVTDDSLNVAGSVQSVALTGVGRGFAFSIAAGGSSTKTVAAGATAQYSLVATASGGFAQAVTFTCSVVNYYNSMVCAVDPNSFTFTATATSTNLTVTVTTRARAIGAPLSGPRMPLGGLGMLTGQLFLMFLLMLVALAAGLRQRRAWVVLAAALLFVTMLAACGASQAPPPPGTPAGTYVISVEGRAPDGTVVTTGLTLIVT
jgi:hypothetical protein